MTILSIITINLNNKNGLLKTIESVLFQPVLNFEFIIIDGGSTDGSELLIEHHKNHFAYWVSEPDKGIYHAMNKGINKAQGEYCLFLNSGDCLTKTVLDDCFQYLISADIVYGNSYLFYSNGNTEPLTYPYPLTMRFFFNATICHQSTFIKRKLLLEYGGYDETLKIHSDYDFWLKAIIRDNCSTKYMPTFVSYYDMSGISSQASPLSNSERTLVLGRYLPKLAINDYDYWTRFEHDMAISLWYRQNYFLYQPMVLLYKIVKNIKKIVGLKY